MFRRVPRTGSEDLVMRNSRTSRFTSVSCSSLATAQCIAVFCGVVLQIKGNAMIKALLRHSTGNHLGCQSVAGCTEGDGAGWGCYDKDESGEASLFIDAWL